MAYARLVSRQSYALAAVSVGYGSFSACEEDGRGQLLTRAACGAMLIAASKMMWDRRTRSPMLVVDCGSASTRVSLLASRRDQVVTLASKKIPVKASDALAGSRKAKKNFAESIAHAVGDLSSSAPVFVGATGGARQILTRRQDAESVNKDTRHQLERELSAQLGHRPVSFRVLSGEEEGEYELRAVQYLSRVQGKEKADELGVLAGGGASIQLGQETDIVSISLDAHASQDLFKSRGLSSAAKNLEWESRRRVINSMYTHRDGSRFKGSFAAIEMASATLRLAISASQDSPHSLSRDEAICALRALRARLEDTASDADDHVTKRHLVYAVQLEAVLDLCFESDTSLILLKDELESKNNKAATRANWSLGFYLARQKEHVV